MPAKVSAKPLGGRIVVLGVTGSVAAMKSPEIALRLRQEGADVHVVMTESARKLAPLALRVALRVASGNKVRSEMFDAGTKLSGLKRLRTRRGTHIDLAERADLLLIAPATANTIANLAHGKTQGEAGEGDLLHTLHLGVLPHKVLVAPAMHTKMWLHPATRENVETIKRRGAVVVPPVKGKLASGDVGEGRMQEPEEIVEQAKQVLAYNESLAGKKVLVNAGPSRVYIDDVRYISNPFGGKLGQAIAAEAAKRGARVTLLQGRGGDKVPVELEGLGVGYEYFETPEELIRLMERHVSSGRYDAIVHSAAINDYGPEKVRGKIRSGESSLDIHLLPLPKVIDGVRNWERAGRGKRSVLVKFKLEVGKTEEQLKRIGVASARDSDADLMVLNAKEWMDTSGRHKTIVIDSQGREISRGTTKADSARVIVDAVQQKLAD